MRGSGVRIPSAAPINHLIKWSYFDADFTPFFDRVILSPPGRHAMGGKWIAQTDVPTDERIRDVAGLRLDPPGRGACPRRIWPSPAQRAGRIHLVALPTGVIAPRAPCLQSTANLREA